MNRIAAKRLEVERLRFRLCNLGIDMKTDRNQIYKHLNHPKTVV